MERFILVTGSVNAMGNTEMNSNSEGQELFSKQDLINHLNQMDFYFTTDKNEFISNALIAFDEANFRKDDSSAYNAGYYTTYDPDCCNYEADSEQNQCLVAINYSDEED